MQQKLALTVGALQRLCLRQRLEMHGSCEACWYKPCMAAVSHTMPVSLLTAGRMQHDWNPQQALRILKAIKQRIQDSNATLLIVDVSLGA